MGPDEKDRAAKRSDDADVEAHAGKRAVDEGLKAPEDKKDDEPDVEAHVRPNRT